MGQCKACVALMILFQLHYICYHIYCQFLSPSQAALGPNHTWPSSFPFTANNTYTVKHNSCWSHALAWRILQQNIRSRVISSSSPCCDVFAEIIMACSQRWQKLDMSKNTSVRAQRSQMTDSSSLFEAGGWFPDMCDRIALSCDQRNTWALQDNWDETISQ